MFATSLSAISEAITEASRVLHSKKRKFDIRVSDDFENGSFGFFISVVNHHAEALATLEALGFIAKTSMGAGGVLGLISMIKGRTIEIETEDVDKDAPEMLPEVGGNDSSEITSSTITSIKIDGRPVIAPESLVKLATNRKVRSALNEVIAVPLEREGTSVVRFKDAQTSSPFVVAEIAKPDALAYDPPIFKEPEQDDPTETTVRFLRADIAVPADGAAPKGWRIIDEGTGQEFSVRMRDKVFIARLRAGSEPNLFAQSYRVQLETKRPPRGTGKRVVRSILHVRLPTAQG